jgi:integrase
MVEGHGWITANVARGVQKPQPAKGNKRALEPGEVKALLDATSPRYKMLFYLALKTGARQAELLGLEWDAISDGCVDIRQQFTGGSITSRLKSKRSNRHIPIDAETERQLRRWRMQSPNSSLVFPSDSGRPQNSSNLRIRGFIPAVKASRIMNPDEVTFHTLRHTFASHAIDSGVPLADVSKYMGHSSVSVTADVYHHLMKGSYDRARAASMDLPDVVGV